MLTAFLAYDTFSYTDKHVTFRRFLGCFPRRIIEDCRYNGIIIFTETHTFTVSCQRKRDVESFPGPYDPVGAVRANGLVILVNVGNPA